MQHPYPKERQASPALRQIPRSRYRRPPPMQPYFIHAQEWEIFSLAGLWSRWREVGGGGVEVISLVDPLSESLGSLLC